MFQTLEDSGWGLVHTVVGEVSRNREGLMTRRPVQGMLGWEVGQQLPG